MAIIKKAKVLEVTGKPLSVETETTDNQVTLIRVTTDEGVFEIHKTGSYSEHLTITTKAKPPTVDAWFVRCVYKDGTTSSQSFTDKGDAHEEMEQKKRLHEFSTCEVIGKKVPADEDGKAKPFADGDDIPF